MTRKPQPGWWIYKEQMDSFCLGDALWEPAPTNYTRISIGDVGFIRDGQFHLLFSAGCPLGERKLGDDVPDTFEVLTVGDPVPAQPRPPGCLRTDTVREVGAGLGATASATLPLEPGASFSFELTGTRGAALVTKYPTYRERSLLESAFGEYTKRHYESWVKFARQKKYGDNVQPVLVYGFDMTRDFAMVAYSNEDASLETDLTIAVPMIGSASASLWGTWRTRCSPHTNHGPQQCCPPPREQVADSSSQLAGVGGNREEFDQCVFIRYYTMRWRKWRFPKVIRAGAGPHDLGSGDNRGGTFPELTVHESDAEPMMDGDEDPRGQWGPIADDTDSEADAVVRNTPYDEEYDTWGAIADYVFQNSDAISVLIHHRDLAGIRMTRDMDDVPALLTKHRPHIVVDASGVGRIIGQEIGKEPTGWLPPLETTLGGVDALINRYEEFKDVKEMVGGLKPQLERLKRSITTTPISGDPEEAHQRIELASALEVVEKQSQELPAQGTAIWHVNKTGLVKFVKRLREAIAHYQISQHQAIYDQITNLTLSFDILLKLHETSLKVKNKLDSTMARLERLCSEEGSNDALHDENEYKLRAELFDTLRLIRDNGNALYNRINTQGHEERQGDIVAVSEIVEDTRDALLKYLTTQQQAAYDQRCRLMDTAHLSVLNGLPRAFGATHQHGNHRVRLRDVQETASNEVELWIKDFNKSPIFWLNGLARTGKSTIAQTVSEWAFADGLLGASFFCSRNFKDRSDLHLIFPTLAFQLAHKYPLFRSILIPLLQSNPDVVHARLYSQMEELIVEPLRSAGVSTVIVIDALDECKDDEPSSAILLVLGQLVGRIPRVKFFITSRPDSQGKTASCLPLFVDSTDVFVLHNDSFPPVTPEDFKLLGIDLERIPSNLADFQSRGSENPTLLGRTRRILDVLDKLVRSATVNSDIRVDSFEVLSGLCLPRGITPDECIFSDKTGFKIDLALCKSDDVTDIQTEGTGGQMGDLVYVKLLRLHSHSQAKLAVIKQWFYHESARWKRISHPNLVPVLQEASGVFLQGRANFAVVTHWVPNGNVTEYLHKHRGADRLELLVQVACGLEHLHSLGIIHGSINPRNILINENGRACLWDIGITRITNDPSITGPERTISSKPNAYRYMPPELLHSDYSRCSYSEAGDIYSMAVTAFEILTGVVPYGDFSEDTIPSRVLNGERPRRLTDPAQTQLLSDPLWEMLKDCWDEDPGLRWEAQCMGRRFSNPTTARVLDMPCAGKALPSAGFTVQLAQLRADDCPKYLTKHLELALQDLQSCGQHGLNLETENVEALLEVFDKVLRHHPFHPPISKWFRRLCSYHKLVPVSYTISGERVNLVGEHPIASGGFGDVWKATCDGRDVAVKALCVYKTEDVPKVKRVFYKEVTIWRLLSHPNVVPCLGVTSSPAPLSVVSEWMPNGNVREYVKEHSEADRLQLLLDICHGLQVLHIHDIVHGDLKGTNILVNDLGCACLTDFGLSTIATFSYAEMTPRSQVGASRWTAPELLGITESKPSPPTRESDIYALAMVTMEVFTGLIPFDSCRGDPAVVLKVISGERPTRPANTAELGLTDELWDLIQSAWAQDVQKRPPVEAIIGFLLQTT